MSVAFSPVSLAAFLIVFLMSALSFALACRRYIQRTYAWVIPSTHIFHALITTVCALIAIIITVVTEVPIPEKIGVQEGALASTWLMGLALQVPSLIIIGAQIQSFRYYRGITFRDGGWAYLIAYILTIISIAIRMAIASNGTPGDVAESVLHAQYAVQGPNAPVILLALILDAVRDTFFLYVYAVAMREGVAGMPEALACHSIDIISFSIAQIPLPWIVLIIPLSWCIQSILSLQVALKMHASLEPGRKGPRDYKSSRGGATSWGSSGWKGSRVGGSSRMGSGSASVSGSGSAPSMHTMAHSIRSVEGGIRKEGPFTQIPLPSPTLRSSLHSSIRNAPPSAPDSSRSSSIPRPLRSQPPSRVREASGMGPRDYSVGSTRTNVTTMTTTTTGTFGAYHPPPPRTSSAHPSAASNQPRIRPSGQGSASAIPINTRIATVASKSGRSTFGPPANIPPMPPTPVLEDDPDIPQPKRLSAVGLQSIRPMSDSPASSAEGKSSGHHPSPSAVSLPTSSFASTSRVSNNHTKSIRSIRPSLDEIPHPPSRQAPAPPATSASTLTPISHKARPPGSSAYGLATSPITLPALERDGESSDKAWRLSGMSFLDPKEAADTAGDATLLEKGVLRINPSEPHDSDLLISRMSWWGDSIDTPLRTPPPK